MPVVTSQQLTSGAYGTGRVGIRKFVEITADQADAMKRVNKFDTTQQFEVFKQLADFGYPKVTGEGAPGILDSRPQLYQASFTPVEYTLMFGITKRAQFTDQYGILSTYKEEMAAAFADGRSLAIANMQNNGFSSSFPGIDGVSLYNTAHPYLSYPTWSNRPSPDLTLSVLNMATAISQIRRVKTARQRPIRFRKGLILHVPPELEDLGTRIITAKGQPQTMDINEPNFVGTRVMTLDVDEDLTTTSASVFPWYLRAADIKQTGLFFLRQMPFDIISSTGGTGGFDPWTRTAYHSCYESYITGWIKAQGCWGSAGA